MRVPAWTAIVLAAFGATAAGQSPEDTMKEAHSVRTLGIAIVMHQQEHHELPADWGVILERLASDNGADPGTGRREAFKTRLLAPGVAAPPLPDNADARWLEQHSSYVYLGRPGVNLDDLSEPLVLIHRKLDQGGGPEGQWYQAFFNDGHTEYVRRDRLERLVRASRAIIDGLATGGPLPDHAQGAVDLGLIAKALRAYAAEHEGVLPPDLGSALAYIPTERLHPPTRAGQAAAFLSPRAKADTHIPEDAAPEWVNQHASYVYLAGGVPLAKVMEPRRLVAILHSRLDDPALFEGPDGRRVERIAIATAEGFGQSVSRPYAEWIIPDSKRVMEWARTGAPLPDLHHALRDLRLIGIGINAYAKAHDDHLPPNLGAVLEFLPPEAGGTAAERARVFLSPRAERITTPPEDADGEWVRLHATYLYLGAEDVTLRRVREGFCALVHGPLDEPVEIVQDEARYPAIPCLDCGGHSWASMQDSMQEAMAEWRQHIASSREPAKP